MAQFVAAGLPLLVTRATLLVDKARLLPGATFVVSGAVWGRSRCMRMCWYYLGVVRRLLGQLQAGVHAELLA